MNKVAEIEELLSQLPVSVLALTETWLEPHVVDTILIPGYYFVHKSRSSGRGGGVGFLIKESIIFDILDMLIPDTPLELLRGYS